MQGQLPCDVLTPSRKWSWSLLSLSFSLPHSLIVLSMQRRETVLRQREKERERSGGRHEAIG